MAVCPSCGRASLIRPDDVEATLSAREDPDAARTQRNAVVLLATPFHADPERRLVAGTREEGVVALPRMVFHARPR